MPLGALHVVGTRLAHELYDVSSGYPWVLGSLVSGTWPASSRQFSLPFVVWIHACIGLHFAWRLRPWYRTWLPAALRHGPAGPRRPASAAPPSRCATSPNWRASRASSRVFDRAGAITPGACGFLYMIARHPGGGGPVLLAGCFAARPVRDLWERRAGVVRLTYGDRKTVSPADRHEVLEMSRLGGIPHASVCGGRGRCSTCRVRVGGRDAACCRRVGGRAEGAGARRRPGQRAACLPAPPAARPLPHHAALPASAGPVEAYRRQPQAHGGERYVAILFADIRGFTSISEGKLPYDVVFLLNRYFRATGQAIEAAGGRLDKFIGDGVMAIFGLDSEPQVACRQALDGARRMSHALDDLNEALSGDLDPPLRIGIGLHAGPAIVGEMGYERAAQLTAIGDMVNTASRLEALTKEFAVELVVSQELLDQRRPDLPPAARHEVEIRGRQGRLAVRAVKRASELTALS